MRAIKVLFIPTSFIVCLALLCQTFLVTKVIYDVPMDVVGQLKRGVFDENAEHFHEKKSVRQAAMITGLAAFLRWQRELFCKTEIVMFSSTENKLSIFCGVEGLPEPWETVVLVFGLDTTPAFLITIIPCQFKYAHTLISRGYIVLYNSHPGWNGIPGPMTQ